MSHDHGRTVQIILYVFESLSYKVQYKVLNAAYYGVGQKRERLIVVGIRGDLANIADFVYPTPDEQWTTLRDVLKDVPESPFQPYSEKKK